MGCFVRSALVVAVVALAACSPAGEPAGAEGGTTSPRRADAGTSSTRPATPTPTPDSPVTRTAPVTPSPPPANAGAGELSITTQSYVACPQIGPSPRSDCGFLPLPHVPVTVTAEGAEPITVRTGDDATVRVPVAAGAVVVTGTAVAEFEWTPEPVQIGVSSRETEAVLLTYGRGPQVPPPPR